MKKFLTCWFWTVAAVLVVPSCIMACITAISTVFMPDGMFDVGSAMLFVVATFFATIFTIGYLGICPALIVLVIGVVLCGFGSGRGSLR